jgi:hypothetical protein
MSEIDLLIKRSRISISSLSVKMNNATGTNVKIEENISLSSLFGN